MLHLASSLQNSRDTGGKGDHRFFVELLQVIGETDCLYEVDKYQMTPCAYLQRALRDYDSASLQMALIEVHGALRSCNYRFMAPVQGFANKDITAFNYYESMMVNGFAPKYVHFVLDDLLKDDEYRIRILSRDSLKRMYRIIDNLHKHKKFSPMMQFVMLEMQKDCPRF